MWYSFWPADTDPETKPLMLIFQGGPYANMAVLWAGNTGPYTLDPAWTGDQAIAPNLIGVDLDSIKWMHASERTNATRNGLRDFGPVDTSKFSSQFGSLAAHDAYFVNKTNGCECDSDWRALGTDAAFANNLRHVSVFMTDARADPLLDSMRVLELLPQVSDIRAGELSVDSERGRAIDFTFDDGLVRSIWIPAYENSWHAVGLFEPEQLADDIRRWLAQTIQ